MQGCENDTDTNTLKNIVDEVFELLFIDRINQLVGFSNSKRKCTHIIDGILVGK